jgi:hypothetical protein
MDGVYETLNFLTGDDLFTHQLPRAFRTVQPFVLDQHPQLRPLGECVKAVTAANWREWLDEQVAKYGESLPLTPIPPEAWTHVDPLAEAEQMVGRDRVIAVTIR